MREMVGIVLYLERGEMTNLPSKTTREEFVSLEKRNVSKSFLKQQETLKRLAVYGNLHLFCANAF